MFSQSNPKYKERYKHRRSTNGKVTREYRAYRDMLNRCYYTKHNRYHRYGGRGISVCERWRGPSGFDNFVDDMGMCPQGMQLDRSNNDKDYAPDNCTWATAKAQALNRSTTHLLTHNGKTMSITEWAEECGVPAGTLERRVNYSGMSVADAIETPVGSADKSHKHFISFMGKTQSLKRWAEELGVRYSLLRTRLIRYGWSVDRAFTTPSLRSNKQSLSCEGV